MKKALLALLLLSIAYGYSYGIVVQTSVPAKKHRIVVLINPKNISKKSITISSTTLILYNGYIDTSNNNKKKITVQAEE